MKFVYSLDEYDYLQYLLFDASQSDRIKKRRRRSWIVNSLTLLCLSFLFSRSENRFLTWYFLIIGLLAACLFPFYLRWRYKKHFKRFVQDTYRSRFGEISTIIFQEEYIETFDITGNSKINLSEIELINETGEYLYLKMKRGGRLIIPKSKIEYNELREELVKMATRLNVKFISELNWKWR
jgi:hypothetical protein